LLINTIPTPDLASFLTIKQDLLYVSAANYFVVLDISDPQNPQITGQLQGTSPNQQLVVENNIAYIAAYNKGLRIIDVSTPSSPALLSEKSIGFNVRGIAKYGNYVYIGGGGSGLHVYNVADPANPAFVTNIYLPDEDGQSLYDIAIWGEYLFIADGSSGIQIVDITIPDNPVLGDSLDTPDSCQGLFIDNLTVIAADYGTGVHLINIYETTDRDGDGVMDGGDAFPDDPTEWEDTDGDGTGNNADMDDDNDGYLDVNDDLIRWNGQIQMVTVSVIILMFFLLTRWSGLILMVTVSVITLMLSLLTARNGLIPIWTGLEITSTR
jgi:hypothetical protein